MLKTSKRKRSNKLKRLQSRVTKMDEKQKIEYVCPDCGNDNMMKDGEEVICSKCGYVIEY
ncbi:TFIIB-type zinc ribbon-containing protein [Nanoarchaeota archaeon]